MQLSKRIQKLSPSATLRVDLLAKNLQANGRDIINLSLGEPDFDTPEEVKKEAIDAINKGFTHYTATAGIKELKCAIANKFLKENKINYECDQIVVGVGSKQLLFNAFQVLCDSGDEVIVATPTWSTYIEQIKLSCAKPIYINLSYPFKLNAKDIEKKLSQKTKLILLNYPANPTGQIIDKIELEKIAILAEKRKIFVISDEIYEKISYTQDHVSIASIGKAIRNLTLTINGFSKTYAMTGWRVGFAGGPKQVIEAMVSLQSQTTSNTSSISQMAALGATELPENNVEYMVGKYKKRRDYIYKRLSKFGGFKFYLPDGAFYFFVGINKFLNETLPSSNAWALKLLEEEGVAVIPGEAFLCSGYLRLSYANSLNNISEGLKRIFRFAQKI